MNRIYGNLKMSWLFVIVFAVVTGAYTGLVMLAEPLAGTSFQDIGINYEWWVIFAVIVVVNCKKNWEAMLKCFVFFAVSQPWVYTVEILLGPMTTDTALMYFRMWLPIIFLTLPGGFIAFYCKKQNALGAVILALANTIQLFMGISYLLQTISNFPYHIISFIVCIASMFVMSYSIQEEKRNRLISLLLPVVLMVIICIVLRMSGRVII